MKGCSVVLALGLAACSGSEEAASDTPAQEETSPEARADDRGDNGAATSAVVTIDGERYEFSGFSCLETIDNGYQFRLPGEGPDGEFRIFGRFADGDPALEEFAPRQPDRIGMAIPSKEGTWVALLEGSSSVEDDEKWQAALSKAEYEHDVAAGTFSGKAMMGWQVDRTMAVHLDELIEITFEIQC
jgi:hypothetical protein